ncbi:hypothetical protein OSTOST_14138 [Ostertagia ostertagi]
MRSPKASSQKIPLQRLSRGLLRRPSQISYRESISEVSKNTTSIVSRSTISIESMHKTERSTESTRICTKKTRPIAPTYEGCSCSLASQVNPYV